MIPYRLVLKPGLVICNVYKGYPDGHPARWPRKGSPTASVATTRWVQANDGALICRLVSRGQLNSPWGLALASADWADWAARCWSATSVTVISTPTTPTPAPIWAKCAGQAATRSSSTACGAW